MRPKKTILLFCPNEITASVLTFNMGVWGHRVTTLHCIGEAIDLLATHYFDLVLLLPGTTPVVPVFERYALELEAIQRSRDSLALIYDSECALDRDAAPGVSRLAIATKSAEELRERLRIALVRKRGPRKLTPPVLLPETVGQQAIAQAFERREAQKRRVA